MSKTNPLVHMFLVTGHEFITSTHRVILELYVAAPTLARANQLAQESHPYGEIDSIKRLSISAGDVIVDPLLFFEPPA